MFSCGVVMSASETPAEVLLGMLPEPHRSLAVLLRKGAEIADTLAWPVRDLVLRLCDELGKKLCEEIKELTMPTKTLSRKEAADLKRDRDHIEALQESLKEDAETLRQCHLAYRAKAQYCNHKLSTGRSAIKSKTITCDCGEKHKLKLCSICGKDMEAPLHGLMAVPVAAFSKLMAAVGPLAPTHEVNVPKLGGDARLN